MGTIMKEDDIYIPTLLEALNLRFAPRQGDAPEWFRGVEEVAEWQKELGLLRPGRPFHVSAAILNICDGIAPRISARWFTLLADVQSYESNRAGQNGDEAIVSALLENFERQPPLPVLFKAHDSRSDPGRRVMIGEDPGAVFYIEQPYLVISLPMRPREK